jgi:hypothetical protein
MELHLRYTQLLSMASSLFELKYSFASIVR